MTTGAQIAATQYNSIRNQIIDVLGSGSGNRGYGQTIQSAAVFSGNIITKAQWEALRYDLFNIKVHQDGVAPNLAEVAPAPAAIRYGAGEPNFNFEFVATNATANRFNIGNGQSILSTKATRTFGTSWSVSATTELTVSFATADDARYFFNSGGKITFTSTRTGGSATSQNNAWTNTLSQAGTQSFGANTPLNINFYTLTNAYAGGEFYQLNNSTPYSANYYQIAAKCDVPNNSVGGATVLTFRITWKDDYVDPDVISGFPAGTNPASGVVDGTLSLVVEELKASGSLQPTGSFTISSPVYSLAVISAT
jgi:hypothetical protein